MPKFDKSELLFKEGIYDVYRVGLRFFNISALDWDQKIFENGSSELIDKVLVITGLFLVFGNIYSIYLVYL